MKQLVDAFISDRTRPEAMAVGIKTVRELAARSPLLMTPDLLQVDWLTRSFRQELVCGEAAITALDWGTSLHVQRVCL